MMYEYVTRIAILNSITRSYKLDKKYIKTREKNVLRDCLISIDWLMDNRNGHLDRMDVPALCNHMESRLNSLQPVVDFIVSELYDRYINTSKSHYYGGRALCGVRYFKPKDFKHHFEKFDEYLDERFLKNMVSEVTDICSSISNGLNKNNWKPSTVLRNNESIRDVAVAYQNKVHNAIIDQVFPKFYLKYWFNERRYQETLNHMHVWVIESFKNMFLSGYKCAIQDMLFAYNLIVDFSDFRLYHLDAKNKERIIGKMITASNNQEVIERQIERYTSEMDELQGMKLNHDPRRVINFVKLKKGICNGS